MPLTKLNSASLIERLPTGSVIQSLHQELTAIWYTADLASTGFTLNITPQFSNSVIRSSFFLNGVNAGNAVSFWQFQLMKGGSFLAYLDDVAGYDPQGNTQQSCNLIYHDTPSSTSQLTYSLSGKRGGGSGNVALNNYGTANNRTRSCFILEEIKQ